jgi:hypothetical protein
MLVYQAGFPQQGIHCTTRRCITCGLSHGHAQASHVESSRHLHLSGINRPDTSFMQPALAGTECNRCTAVYIQRQPPIWWQPPMFVFFVTGSASALTDMHNLPLWPNLPHVKHLLVNLGLDESGGVPVPSTLPLPSPSLFPVPSCAFASARELVPTQGPLQLPLYLGCGLCGIWGAGCAWLQVQQLRVSTTPHGCPPPADAVSPAAPPNCSGSCEPH